MTDYIRKLDAVQDYLRECDHFDCKTIEGQVTLREFIAAMLSYYPAWIKSLYAIRWGFVRLLGMKQEGMPDAAPNLQPEDISFVAGNDATFFKVERAEEGRFWVASAEDKHLIAYIIVAVEPLTVTENRFHVATIVRYNNWAGPVYFNVIRPFHHVVVRAMMRAGVESIHRQGRVVPE